MTMLRDTAIKEIMVKNIITMQINEPFSRVEEKLRKNRIRHLPVVDHKNCLVGIVTQRDLYHAMAPRETESGDYYDKMQLDSLILEHHMTKDPLSLKPENTLAEVIDIMATRKFGCIPIVNDGKELVGIVTQIDVLKFIAKWLSIR